jgi:hypothetical protein
MHEFWLQKYIKEHFRQIGFSQLHGPYKYGADFKGVLNDKPVKIEAEWGYSDYISHKHSLKFADILVVATLEPLPQRLKANLPSIIINLDPERVIQWAQPRLIQKDQEDYHAYPWRRFSRNLLFLFDYYQKQNHHQPHFIGSNLVRSMSNIQKPEGFEFGSGGKEDSFEGPPEDKAAWDYWLHIAHSVAENFRLRPALLRMTWIDRVSLYTRSTGRITGSEIKRFDEVALFIDDLLQKEIRGPISSQ